MSFLSNDKLIIMYGADYLKPVSLTFPFMAISQIYYAVQKSMENTRFCAVNSSVRLVINIVLDMICVLFLFPDNPESAVPGVAWSTAIARFIELIVCLIHSGSPKGIKPGITFYKTDNKFIFNDFIKYTAPVMANYLVWGVALTVTATIIGHISSQMVAAYSIVSVIRNLTLVLVTGLSSGGAILIGKYLGSGDIEYSRKLGDKTVFYVTLSGILACLVTISISGAFKYNSFTDRETSVFIVQMLYISGIYLIGKALNSAIIGGILLAGGDSKFGFLCDTFVMWGIVIPLSLVSAFIWHLSPILIFVIISLDEVIKLPLALSRYKKYKWLNNITREL